MPLLLHCPETSPALLLCGSLILFLRGDPVLDEESLLSLRGARTEIDRALASNARRTLAIGMREESNVTGKVQQESSLLPVLEGGQTRVIGEKEKGQEGKEGGAHRNKRCHASLLPLAREEEQHQKTPEEGRTGRISTEKEEGRSSSTEKAAMKDIAEEGRQQTGERKEDEVMVKLKNNVSPLSSLLKTKKKKNLVVCCSPSSVSSSSASSGTSPTTTNVLLPRASQGTSLFSSSPPPSPSSSSSSFTSLTKKGGRRKKNALLALYPYTELTEAESSTTVMLRFFGPNFTRQWQRRRRIIIPLTWAAGYYLGAFFTVLSPREKMTDTTRFLITSMVSSPCLLWILVHYSSLMNLSLLQQSLRMFDTQWFLLESSLLLCVLLPFIFCLTGSAAVFSVNIFLGSCIGFVFYDSLPVFARRGLRISLFLSAFFYVMLLLVLYLRLSPFPCFYRLDTSAETLVTYEEDAATVQRGCSYPPEHHYGPGDESNQTGEKEQSGGFGLRVSLFFDFCLNRLFTVTILTLKISYSAFVHPQDGIMLKSRLRLVEMARIDRG